MIFAQQKPTTWWTFGDPWHTVEVERTPHYRHLIGELGFADYLVKSWGSADGVDEHIWQFERLATACCESGIIEPVTLLRRSDGCDLIIDGNHRAAISRAYGLPLKVQTIDIHRYYVKLLARMAALRFAAPAGVPYQPMTYMGETIIHGRRSDIEHRHSMLLPEDLAGTVLDYGCNIGASSLLCHQSGAKVYAVDVPEILITAIRIFVAHGYDITPTDALTQYDTGLFFSVHRHTDISEPMSRCKVVYVETHEDGRLPETDRKFERVGALGKRVLYRASN